MARISWEQVPAEVRDAVCEHTGSVITVRTAGEGLNSETTEGRTVQVSFSQMVMQVGETATIYYSVDDPTYAQLDEGWPFENAAAIVTSIVLSIASWLYMIGYFIRKLGP